MKVADGPDAAAKAAGDAMRQIQRKGYADKYRTGAVLIGLAIDRTKRQVGAFRVVPP
jgi:hypothetical protein